MHKLYYGIGACSFVPHAALEAIREATGEAYETQLVKLNKLDTQLDSQDRARDTDLQRGKGERPGRSADD